MQHSCSHLSLCPTGAHIGSFLLLGTPDFPSGGRNPPLHSHGMGPPGGPMGSGGHMPRSYPPSDDIDPQATRSLFVGNIPKNISVFQLRDIFQRYGDVLVSCVRMWCLCVCMCIHVCLLNCVHACACVYLACMCMAWGHRCSLVNHSQGPVQLSVAPQYGKAGNPGIFSHVNFGIKRRFYGWQ